MKVDGLAGRVEEIAAEDMMPAGGGTSDEDLKAEVLRVVAGAAAHGEPLPSMNAIYEQIKTGKQSARKQRVIDTIKSLLDPGDGRLTGGSGKPFAVVDRENEPAKEATP